MICVYQAANGVEAAIVRGLLEEHGIRAQVFGQWLSSGAGDLPVDQYPRIMIVDTADLERARSLVSDYESGRSAAPNWTCSCGETHAGRFSHCWNCGAARPNV